MNKKHLIFCIVSTFISFNGLAKGITEDMLIGDWRCEVILGKETTYTKTGDIDEVFDIRPSIRDEKTYVSYISYRKEGDVMTIEYDDSKPRKFNLKNLSNDIYIPDTDVNKDPDDRYEYNNIVKFIYLSDDAYKKVSDVTFRRLSSKIKFENRYYKSVCKRMTYIYS